MVPLIFRKPPLLGPPLSCANRGANKLSAVRKAKKY